MDDDNVLLDGKTLGNLRVVDLKQELEKRGLSKSGSKKDLVKRLKQQLEFEKLCGERKLAGDCETKLELDAVTEQNEFVQQYLAQQQKIIAEQKEAKRLIELEEIQKSSDEKESCESTKEDENATGDDEDGDQTEPDEPDVTSETVSQEVSLLSKSSVEDISPKENINTNQDDKNILSNVEVHKIEEETQVQSHLKPPQVVSDSKVASQEVSNEISKKDFAKTESPETISSEIHENVSLKSPEGTDTSVSADAITAVAPGKDVENSEIESPLPTEEKSVADTKTSDSVPEVVQGTSLKASNNSEEISNESFNPVDAVSEMEPIEKQSSVPYSLTEIQLPKNSEKDKKQTSKDDTETCHSEIKAPINGVNAADKHPSNEVHSSKPEMSENIQIMHEKKSDEKDNLNVTDCHDSENDSVLKKSSDSRESYKKHKFSDGDNTSSDSEGRYRRKSKRSKRRHREEKRSPSYEKNKSRENSPEYQSKKSIRKHRERKKSGSYEKYKSRENSPEYKSKERIRKHRDEKRRASCEKDRKESPERKLREEKLKSSEKNRSRESSPEEKIQVDKIKHKERKESDSCKKNKSRENSPIDLSQVDKNEHKENRSGSRENSPEDLSQEDKNKHKEKKRSRENSPENLSQVDKNKHKDEKINESCEKSKSRENIPEEKSHVGKRKYRAERSESCEKSKSRENSPEDISHVDKRKRRGEKESESSEKNIDRSPEDKSELPIKKDRGEKCGGSKNNRSRESSPKDKPLQNVENSNSTNTVSQSLSAKTETSREIEGRPGSTITIVKREPIRQKLKIKRDNVKITSMSFIEKLITENVSSIDHKESMKSKKIEKPSNLHIDTHKSKSEQKGMTKISDVSKVIDKETFRDNSEGEISRDVPEDGELSKDSPEDGELPMEVETSNENSKSTDKIEPSANSSINTSYVSRKIMLSSRKISLSSDDKPKIKRGKWGSLSTSQKSNQAISISTDSLKNWFPDFKLLKDPVNEAPIDELGSREEIEVTTLPNKQVEDMRQNLNLKRKHNDIEEKLEAAEEKSGPVSKILYIKNLVRPFTLNQLKELLRETGNFSDEDFWIDKIKSKCFVIYETEDEAIKTRTILNGMRWPSSNPKILLVDFSNEEEMTIQKSGSDLPRIPVAPSVPEPPELQEDRPLYPQEEFRRKDQEREHKRERPKYQQPMREWDKDKLSQESPERSRNVRDSDRSKTHDKKEKKDSKKRANEDTPAKLLDDLFQKTKSLPCIYWLPLNDEQVKERAEMKRLRRLEREKRNQKREQDESEQKNKQQRSRNRPRETDTKRSPSRSRSPVPRRR